MEPGRLDETARQLAATSSRGHALRVLAGGVFGTAFLLGGAERAFADKPPAPPGQGKCDCSDLEARIAKLEQICATVCGGGGGGGGGTGCTSAAQCPPAGVCQQATCVGGVCGTAPLAAGTACAAGVCDGAGHCVTCLSGADCGTATPCTTPVCVGGVCSTTNTAAGTPCPGGTCDGQGTCVTANPCSPNPCNTPPASTCTGTISTSYSVPGTCTNTGGSATCTYTPTTRDCSPYLCKPNGCPATCAADVDCIAGSVCRGSVCVPGP